ncbi:agrin-like isoform X2 [Acanthaster planci]|uniref:Agrin-like isoform X2 n=1 Tax=Acanthaster planci TaxID=133434 RepID=A0A8B7Z6I3_ACAPL|nr:agrin-like isoform X2 [Acanthaster planci]
MDHRGVTMSVLLAVIAAVLPAASQPLYGRLRAPPKCSEPLPLEQRAEIANVILTGFVDKVMRKPRTLQYECEVQIVRIFKGEETVHNGISPPMDPESNQVMVTGFGDPSICDNAAHVGDVKLLLLKKDHDGHLRLNSSLVRITLGNLDRTNAVVMNVPYVTREPISEGPCATILCAYGSICRETLDQEAECFCPEECPNTFSPVCGTDGVTYNNECYLKSSSCRLRTRITAASSGPCDLTSLCLNKHCPFGAECMIKPDSMSAECVCPQECASADFSRVCGSDGSDYPNECELKRASCLQRRNIRIIFQGTCNPCSTANLDQDAVCKLNRNREPIADCIFDCDELPGNPVCASDGLMYESECLMRRVACQSRFELFVLEESYCKPEKSPCRSFQCEFGKCILDLEGNPTCVCISSCPEIYVPICGSDGVTYYSICHLQREQCLRNEAVHVISNGPCLNQSEGLCSAIRCGYGAVCLVVENETTCSCDRMCTDEDRPVCGTDEVTYGNACLLKQAACEQQKEIRIESEGLCNGCELHTCDFGAICEMGPKGPQCVCPEECVNFDSPVCGSDDVTYANECELNVQACRQQAVISVVSQGECIECEGVKCEYGAICNRGKCSCPTCADIEQRVCGTNQISYQSICHLRAEMCNERIRIAVAFDGPCEDAEMSGSGNGTDGDQEGGDGDRLDYTRECDESMCQFGGTCEFMTNGNSYCSCIMNCPATRLPVCGSNQVTYGSECLLREASCEQQKPIYVESQGSCEDVEMEPCDGDSPLLMPNTMEEYTCSEEGEECPSGSYCHIHPLRKFAVCCPVTREQTSPPSCEDTMYGCCPDGVTAAQGFNEAGCPSHCDCNDLGSYSPVCNPSNKQCPCKPGVGGKKCDRCEPGFWDFRGIQNGNIGCRPCGCSKGGSARDDCEQMLGKCMCKGKAMGIKCDMCPKGMMLGATGCQEVVNMDDSSNLCEQLNCRYHATCQFTAGLATCVCPSNCTTVFEPVCGSDGQTYGNECQLKVFACRLQRDVQLYARGICNSVVITPMTISQECVDSEFGCCDDGETPKKNPEGAGCPLLPGMTTASMTPTMRPSSSATMKPEPSDGTRISTESPVAVTTLPLPPVEVSSVSAPPPEITTLSSPPLKSRSSTLPQLDATTLPSPPLETSTQPIMTEPAFRERSTVQISSSTDSSRASVSLSKTSEASSETSSSEAQTSASSSKSITSVSETSKPVTRTMPVSKPSTDASETLSSFSQTSMPISHTSLPSSESFSKTVPLTSTPSLPPSSKMSSLPVIDATTPDETKPMPQPQTQGLTTQFHASPTDPTTVMPSSTSESLPEFTTQPRQTTEPTPLSICETNPCLHGGTCLEKESATQGYICICPVGRGGPVCEEVVTFQSPSLSEHSYLAFPKMRAFFDFDIVLEFQAEADVEGLLLFNGQDDVENKDFVSLAIVSGSVELRYNVAQEFDLGSSDTVVIRSTVPIQPLHWYTIRATRDKRDGTLSVDGETPVMGSSSDRSSGLSLTNDLFIGDVPEDKELIYKVAGTTKGFMGCIGYLEVNHKPLDVYHPGGDILYGANIGECGNDPCLAKPCLNNATCTPMNAEQFECECEGGFVGPLCGDVFVDPCEGNMCYTGSTCMPLPEGGYRCDCPMGWLGDMCDMEDEPEPVGPFIPGFGGNSYLELPGLKAPSHITVEVEFLATQPNGMIFYNGQSTNGNGDFISLNLVDGYLEFRYNLGSGTAEIRSPERLTLNEWHRVEVTRMNMDGMMYIDNQMVAQGESSGLAKQLNLKQSLFIGGTDNYSKFSRKAGITDGFVGGIKMLSIDREEIPDLIEASLQQANIQRFVEHPCVGSPCMPTYLCVPEDENYSCVCPPGTEELDITCVSMETSTASGDHMTVQNPVTEKQDTNAPVSFDGQSYFSYPNIARQIEKAQNTNIIKMRFRTLRQAGLMLYNSDNSRGGDFVAVAIVNGQVEFAYNLGAGVKRISSPVSVNDDQWHTVIISRTRRESSIQVDDEAPSLGTSKAGSSFLNTDGIMWIGGHSSLQSNVPFEYRTGFQGCITDVELQETSLHLYNDAREQRPSSFCDYPEA